MPVILDNGVLRSRQILGRQTIAPRKNTGISLQNLQRLLETKQPQILILRSLGGIGDVLMSTPMVRALKYKWSESRITYATDFKYMNGALRDVLLYNPYIDELIPYQAVVSQNYDFTTDITGVAISEEKSLNKAQNRIDIFARHIGVDLSQTGYIPTYIVSDEEKKWAQEKLSRYPRRHSSSPRIGIQVRSSTVSRNWPLEKFRELAIRLNSELGAQVCIFDSSLGGGERDEWNISGLIAFKDYGLRQVAALIDEMDLFICLDSGLLHLAGALNKRIVSIFGPTDPDARINRYPNALAVWKREYMCSPCWYAPTACNRTYICLEAITVEEVFSTVKNHLPAPLKTEISIGNALQFSASNELEKYDYYVFRDNGIGDIVNCLPAFAGFKKMHSDKTIALITMQENIEFVQNTGIFDAVLGVISKQTPIRTSKKLFDARDLFEKNIKNGTYFEDRPRYHAMADFLGCDYDSEAYKLSIDEDTQEEMKSYIRRLGVVPEEEKLVIIQPFATCKTRSWLDNYANCLAEYISKLGFRPVFVHSSPSYNLDCKEALNLTGRLNIKQLNAMVSLSKFVISVDSGCAHLAGANDIPFIVIINAIPAKYRFGLYKNYSSIQPELPCSPCWDRQCQDVKCMKMTTPEIILAKFKEMINALKI